MAVTRQALPKLVLAGAAAAPALLLVRALLVLCDLIRHDAGPAAMLPVVAFAAVFAVAVALPLLALRMAPARRANVALALVSATAVAYAV